MSASLPELLSAVAASRPDAPALVEPGGRTLTWSELDREVDRVAGGLDAMGLVAGYRVMVATGNRVEFVTSYLGALRARLVAVPVNPRSATGELARMMADSGSRVVVADRTALTGVRQAVAGLEDALVGADEELVRSSPVPRLVVVGGLPLTGETAYADLLVESARARPGRADPETLAVLLYTSGTSGRPRGAMLTSRALTGNVEQAAAVRPTLLSGEDVVLGMLPLFHVYGLNAVLGQVVRQGACLVLVDGSDPEAALDVVERHGVTVLPVAPAILAAWQSGPSAERLAQRLAGVRVVLSGSAPLSPDLVRWFATRAATTVHQGYGLTEAAPVVTSTLCSAAPPPGSVGAALPGIELRLVDEAGGSPEHGDPGEVLLRGVNLFSGYWPEGAGGPDEDGWYATGDVGLLDAEGDLLLVDRRRELVLVSGFNVYPVEVEEVLLEVPGVAEAAVIGRPDDLTGEAVLAYVTRAVPAGDGTDADLVSAVHRHAADRLARFKRPTEVLVVDALPHTVTGKVAKGRLRAARARGRGLP